MKFKKVLIFLSITSFSLLHAKIQIYYGEFANQYKPIRIELTFDENKSISGYYLDEKKNKKIKLVGKYDKNSFLLNESNATLTGTFSDKKISGVRKSSSSGNNFFYGYTQKNINLFKDKKFTCDEIKAYPELIFVNGLDLGSGNCSPLEVDYSCEGSLYTLNFINRLYSLTEDIRGYYQQGSIVHALLRYYHFHLLNAGLAPDIYMINSAKKEKSYRTYEDEKNYFAVWGHASLQNYELYKSFWSEYDRAYSLLVEHYMKKFSITKNQAIEYASYALKTFVSRAAGAFPSSYKGGKPSLTSLEKLIINSNTTLNTLKSKLKDSVLQTELNRGLKVAILYHRGIDFIKSLLEKGASIDSGDESALFFALKNKEIMKFLLDKGASVNYRNSFGKTILYYAIELDDIEMVKMLLKKRANVNNRYIDAKTKKQLMYKNSDKIPIYQSLSMLRHTKRTPLMHAAQHASVDMLKLLISNGANKDAVDEIGSNVIDYAYWINNEKNISYLKSIGLTITKDL